MATYKLTDSPLSLEGLTVTHDERFCRLPEQLLGEQHPETAHLGWLAENTAGGCVRFRTNSRSLGLKLRLPGSRAALMPHMAATGSSSCDVYREDRFIYSLKGEPATSTEIHGSASLSSDGQLHDYRVNLPLYNPIVSLELSFDDDAAVEPPTPHRIAKPVAFYGSSITQGGCASRPGLSYSTILARRFDFPLINLGFSGNAKGERAIAEYIASLELSAFVLDYDHNAPSIDHLRATHRPFFELIRSRNPELPIIMTGRPDCFRTGEDARLKVIRETYEAALASGDKQVYFIDARTLWGESEYDNCTVDGCHPNDIGFLRMADAFTNVFSEIFPD